MFGGWFSGFPAPAEAAIAGAASAVAPPAVSTVRRNFRRVAKLSGTSSAIFFSATADRNRSLELVPPI
jgi:hypothetical protein